MALGFATWIVQVLQLFGVTDKPGKSWVEIAPDGPDHFYGKARPRYYDILEGRKVLTDSVHRVHIEGLKPNTKYRYRVFTQEVAEWRMMIG